MDTSAPTAITPDDSVPVHARSNWAGPLPPRPLRERVRALVIGVLISAGWMAFSLFALPYAGEKGPVALLVWPAAILVAAMLVLLLIRQARLIAAGMAFGLVLMAGILYLTL